MNGRTLALGSALLTASLTLPPAAAAAVPPSRLPALPEHRLYVANPVRHEVEIFPAGIAQPKRAGTITNGLSQPVDVFVDPARTLYVLNQSPAFVAIYPRDHARPSKIVQLGGGTFPTNLTVTPSGTIVVSTYQPSNGQYFVLEVPPAKNAVTYAIPFGKNYYPTGVAADAQNRIYVAVDTAVYIYRLFSVMPVGEVPQQNYSGALQIDGAARLLVGHPYVPGGGDGVAFETLPAGHVVKTIFTASAGDYIASDARSQFLYASAYGSNLQVYDKMGRFVGLMSGSGFGYGIAVDP